MTKIFKNYQEFLSRTDKSVNGISQKFADENPKWKEQNSTNKGCWNCDRCMNCSGCSDCIDCIYCRNCSGCSDCIDYSDCSDCIDSSHCMDCIGCSGCSYCNGCRYCNGCSYSSYCSGCSYSSYCSYCSDCSDYSYCHSKIGDLVVPKIENIHQKVLEAVSVEGALNMDDWHSNTCETTHCRAGWVVTLAGAEGKELEEKTSTAFAARQIYRVSSNIKVSPWAFYVSNEEAIEDIERCALQEKQAI